MEIKAISNSKQNAGKLDLSEPPVATRSGTAAYVIETHKDLMCRNESIALLALIALSEKDIESGRTLSRMQLMELLSHPSIKNAR